MYWLVARGLLGAVLATLVVLLGLRTAAAHPEPIIVAVFGIVAALLGPTAISLVAGAFPSRRSKALDQLAKAGEIEQRVAEAETMQQKVRALEDERRRLATIIRFEARRQLVLDRQEVLQSEVQQLTQQAEQVLAELKAIEEEGRLLGEEIDNSAAKRDIMAVRERLKRERTGSGHRSVKWIDLLLGDTPFLLFGSAVRPIVHFSAERSLDEIEKFRTQRLTRRAKRASSGTDAEQSDDSSEPTDVDEPPGQTDVDA